MVKIIDLKELKNYDQKLFLNFLIVHYLYRHFEDIRLKFRKDLGKALLKYNFRDAIKIIDNENKIVTLCNYSESEYTDPNGEFFQHIVDIRPRPFIDLTKTNITIKFPQQIKPIDIMKSLIKTKTKRD